MPEQSPLLNVAAKRGGILVEDRGWIMPADYGDAKQEYETARSSAVCFDLSHHGKIELTGRDAGTFLHNLCTNEVVKLPVGGGCEAFLTTSQARIVAYVLIYRTRRADETEAFQIDAGAGMGEKVFKHLDRFLISEQLEIVDRTTEYAQLHVAGPAAASALDKLGFSPLPGPREPSCALVHWKGISCQVRCNDPLRLAGHDLLVPSDQAGAVWKQLVAAGIQPAGLEAYEILRIEAGTPVNGRDVDETNLPQELARVERTISFTKGCYIGQETVARIRTYGHVNRSLVGLRLEGTTSAPQGAKLLRDGKEVGQVTSSTVSPRYGVIALGYVRRGNEEPGTGLECKSEGASWPATVAGLPFTGFASAAP